MAAHLSIVSSATGPAPNCDVGHVVTHVLNTLNGAEGGAKTSENGLCALQLGDYMLQCGEDDNVLRTLMSGWHLTKRAIPCSPLIARMLCNSLGDCTCSRHVLLATFTKPR